MKLSPLSTKEIIDQKIQLSLYGFPASPTPPPFGNMETCIPFQKILYEELTPEKDLISSKYVPVFSDRLFRLNCDSQGGNSGGPVVYESNGSLFVAGILILGGIPGEGSVFIGVYELNEFINSSIR